MRMFCKDVEFQKERFMKSFQYFKILKIKFSLKRFKDTEFLAKCLNARKLKKKITKAQKICKI